MLWASVSIVFVCVWVAKIVVENGGKRSSKFSKKRKEKRRIDFHNQRGWEKEYVLRNWKRTPSNFAFLASSPGDRRIWRVREDLYFFLWHRSFRQPIVPFHIIKYLSQFLIVHFYAGFLSRFIKISISLSLSLWDLSLSQNLNSEKKVFPPLPLSTELNDDLLDLYLSFRQHQRCWRFPRRKTPLFFLFFHSDIIKLYSKSLSLFLPLSHTHTTHHTAKRVRQQIKKNSVSQRKQI